MFDDYIELDKYAEQTYDLSVRRCTTGAFLRHKLGAELAKMEVSSEVLDSKPK